MLNDPETLAEITSLADLYEKALGDNDLGTLDALFHDGPETVRYGVGRIFTVSKKFRNFGSVGLVALLRAKFCGV